MGDATCVEEALRHHRAAGTVCALLRQDALDGDAAAVATTRSKAARVHGLDTTRFICDARRCYPVVGGALVHKDEHHLTTIFAETVGPYLQRAVDRFMGSARRSQLLARSP